MPRIIKLIRAGAFVSTPVELYEVDGVRLSEEEVNVAKLLIDKLAKEEKNSVMDFKRASKWRLRKPRRPTKN
jgi:hypothetical protein